MRMTKRRVATVRDDQIGDGADHWKVGWALVRRGTACVDGSGKIWRELDMGGWVGVFCGFKRVVGLRGMGQGVCGKGRVVLSGGMWLKWLVGGGEGEGCGDPHREDCAS